MQPAVKEINFYFVFEGLDKFLSNPFKIYRVNLKNVYVTKCKYEFKKSETQL